MFEKELRKLHQSGKRSYSHSTNDPDASKFHTTREAAIKDGYEVKHHIQKDNWIESRLKKGDHTVMMYHDQTQMNRAPKTIFSHSTDTSGMSRQVKESKYGASVALEEPMPELSEVSKALLGRYIKKAHRSSQELTGDAIEMDRRGHNPVDLDRVIDNRMKGIDRATDRLVGKAKISKGKPKTKTYEETEATTTNEETENLEVTTSEQAYGVVDSVIAGESSTAAELLGQLIQDRAYELVTGLKQDMAQTVFAGEQPVEPQVEEEIEDEDEVTEDPEETPIDGE